MRLHYYTTAVPNSYCVGVHNGHGFGSLFAKLFSKVAAKTIAKTAAKAIGKVARVAGRKALKVVTTKGADLAKKAAKHAIEQAVEVGGNFAVEKLNSLTENALKTKLPQDLVHSASDFAKQGVKAVEGRVTNAASRSVEAAIDKGVTKAEQVAGIKRKQPSTKKKSGKKRKSSARDQKWNSLVQLMNQDE